VINNGDKIDFLIINICSVSVNTMTTVDIDSNFLSPYTVGKYRDAVLLRKVIGFGSLYELSLVNPVYTDYAAICDARAAQFGVVGIVDQSTERFVTFLKNMCEKRLLVTSAELGYLKSDANVCRTYVGFYMPRDFVDHLKECSWDTEDVHVYICDAEQEIAMRKKEIEAGLGPNVDKTIRSIKHICSDLESHSSSDVSNLERHSSSDVSNLESHLSSRSSNTTPYHVFMFLRYNYDDILKFGDKIIMEMDKYVFVQICSVRSGCRTELIESFIRGVFFSLAR
jgi:hypothetical protein